MAFSEGQSSWQSLDDENYEERLESLNLTTLETRRFHEDVTEVL
jgi:hypothetical protein